MAPDGTTSRSDKLRRLLGRAHSDEPLQGFFTWFSSGIKVNTGAVPLFPRIKFTFPERNNLPNSKLKRALIKISSYVASFIQYKSFLWS